MVPGQNRTVEESIVVFPITILLNLLGCSSDPDLAVCGEWNSTWFEG